MKGIINKSLKNITFIDLFAGLGGFRLALESFGAKCIWADEWNEHVANVYYQNFGMKPHGDITKIPTSDVPKCDIVCAGFPCQAFSISGKQLGFKDTRGTLFFDVARIVKAHQPKIVLMENVKNLVHHDHGRTFKVIKNTMEELGYDFYWKVLDASDFNVPQSRKRVYMVAFRKDLDVHQFNFPTPIQLGKHLKNILLPITQVPQSRYIHRNDVQWNHRYDKISNHPNRLGQVGQGRQGERIYGINGTSITLSAYGGGVFAKTGGYLIHHHLRRLMPRECARLMGFPDNYVIDKSPAQAYQQFGNSVVINVLQAIISEIVKQLKIR